MNEHEELIKKGEKLREIQKDFDGALAVFREAQIKAETPLQNSAATKQIGLTLEHMDDLEGAISRYQSAYKMAGESDEDTALAHMARSKRHISSCQRKLGQYEEAFKNSAEARELMLRVEPIPNDLVWVTHGAVDALIDAGQMIKACQWLLKEREDVRYMLSREKDQLRRDVWLTGYLMDIHKIFGFFAYPAKLKAERIAESAGLQLRQEQLKGERK